MSLNSWQASISRKLSRRHPDSRIAILGIGNVLRSDDAAGILVARDLMDSRTIRDLNTVLVIDAGHAPENHTAQLRPFAPDLVLFVDAAEMGEPPGTVRLIGMDEIEGMSASTHSLPLSMLATYLSMDLHCDIQLLGIQPKSNDVGETLSGNVAQAVQEIVEFLMQALASHR